MKTSVSFRLLLLVLVGLFIPQSSGAQERDLGLGRPAKTQGTKETVIGEQGQPELIVQTGYGNFSGKSEVKFSPDGRLLALSLQGGVVKLWEVATGRELRTFVSPQSVESNGAQPLAFSPDGTSLAVGGGDAVIRVWNVLTGRLVSEWPPTGGATPVSPLRYMAFKPDGRMLISVSDVASVRDITTGRELNTYQPSGQKRRERGAPLNGAGAIALSHDGAQLLIVNSIPGEGLKRQGVAQVNDPARWGESEFVGEVRVEIVKTSDGATTSNARRLSLPGVESYTGLSMLTASFNANGAALLAGIDGRKLKLWDVTAGKAPALLASDLADPAALFFSPDGRLVGVMTSTALRLWDTMSGQPRATLKLPLEKAAEQNLISAVSAAISHDGRFLATIRDNSALVLWDVATASIARRIVGSGNPAYAVSFSADGKQLFSGGRTRWDLDSGTGSRYAATGGETGDLRVPSPQGDKLASVKRDNDTVSMFDAISGLNTGVFAPPSGAGKLRQIFFSPSGNILVAIYSAGGQKNRRLLEEGEAVRLKLWDTDKGTELRTLICPQGALNANISRDGRYVATADRRGEITVWDVGAARALYTISPFTTREAGVAPAVTNHTSEQTLKKPESSEGSSVVSALAFSPDGKMLATGAAGRTVLWDTSTGQSIGEMAGDAAPEHLAFSEDGKRLAGSKIDRTIQIWDVATRVELLKLEGHRAHINSLTFSPDARLLASASDDGSTYLWDAAKGDHLATLVSMFDGGEWLVITPDGLFDGTPTSLNQILWRYDEDTFNVAPVEWFFNEFYQPGLLAELVDGKRPKAAQSFALKERRQPRVALSLAGVHGTATKVAERHVTIKIQVTEESPGANATRGSGAQDLRLFRNGSLVKYWRGGLLGGGGPDAVFEATVPIVAGENSFVAYAFNRDNVKSVDARLSVTGDESLKRGGVAYILSIGINKYANARYDLRFAVADALTFQNEVLRQQNRLRLYETVEIIHLYDHEATKENILRALADLAVKAQPEDGVAIFYAGHGTAQDKQFYLVPHDLGYAGDRGKLSAPELQTLLAHSISDRELEAAFEKINSGRLILVLDTCNSGQALEAEDQRRGPMNSKGLAQLAYDKGMYVLAAAQSFQAAQEVEQLGHGLLTYALIEEGLKQRAADFKPRDGAIVIREWFDYATTRVPQIQVAKIKEVRSSSRSNLFAENDTRGLLGTLQRLQRPRVFYRRELESQPLIVARQ